MNNQSLWSLLIPVKFVGAVWIMSSYAKLVSHLVSSAVKDEKTRSSARIGQVVKPDPNNKYSKKGTRNQEWVF